MIAVSYLEAGILTQIFPRYGFLFCMNVKDILAAVFVTELRNAGSFCLTYFLPSSLSDFVVGTQIRPNV
jgi:hypothetical protein